MAKNSELKPVKLRLKIDLVSYPARAEGLGEYDYLVCGRSIKAEVNKDEITIKLRKMY